MSETDALDQGMTKGEPTLEQWRSIARSLFDAGERSGHEVIEANAAILDLDRSDDLLERSERCFRRAAELNPNKSARARLMEVAQRYREMRMMDRASDLEAFLERLRA